MRYKSAPIPAAAKLSRYYTLCSPARQAVSSFHFKRRPTRAMATNAIWSLVSNSRGL